MRISHAAAVIACLPLLAPAALAITIAPGDYTGLNNQAGALGQVDGTLLTSASSTDASGVSQPNTFASSVFLTTQNTHTFSYTIGPGPLPFPPGGGALEIHGFNGFTTDILFPAAADQSLWLGVGRSADGDTLHFDASVLGGASALGHLVVRTNAPAFGVNRAHYLIYSDAGPTPPLSSVVYDFASVLAPAAGSTSVPEPAALSALGLGVGLCTWSRRRKLS